MNTIGDVNERHGVGEEDACLALSSLSFDLSVYDVFGLLSAGGRVVLPSSESTAVPSPSYWLSLVSSEGVSVWNSVPAFVELLVGDAEHHGSSLPRCLRLVLMSGDWISPGLPSRLGALRASAVAGGGGDRSVLRVVSIGRATEAAVWSVTYEVVGGVVPPGWSSVPYGVGMRNQPVDVLDETCADGVLRRCDVWTTGMIYLGGLGVAHGHGGESAVAGGSGHSGFRFFHTFIMDGIGRKVKWW